MNPRVKEPRGDGSHAMRRSAVTLAIAVTGALLSACATPDAPPAQLDVQLSQKFNEAVDTNAQGANGQWWSQFGDEELTQLIARALDKNQDVQIGLQRVKAAQSSVTVATSALLPSVDAVATGQRSASHLPVAVKAAGEPDILGYQAGLQLSWEIDLSGSLRAARSASKSDLVAAQAGVVGTRLEVASEVARQYFIYRSAERRLALLEQLAASKRQSAKLVSGRVEQGESSPYELDLAQSDADALDALVPALRSLCTSTQASMAVLLGINPSEHPISIAPNYVWPAALEIASGQPSDLLRRRPDLLAAESRYAAQTMRAVEARDQMWPRLFLGVLIGNEGLKLNAIDLSPVHFSNVAAQFAMPLFNSGRISAAADGQDAIAKETLMQWQHSALVAVQEVESSLAVKKNEEARGASVSDELSRRQSALKRVQSLFREGQVGQLTVLDVQRAELSGELDAVDSNEKRVLSYVQLYKALGGGWSSPSQTETNVSVSMNDQSQRSPK